MQTMTALGRKNDSEANMSCLQPAAIENPKGKEEMTIRLGTAFRASGGALPLTLRRIESGTGQLEIGKATRLLDSPISILRLMTFVAGSSSLFAPLTLYLYASKRRLS